MSLIIFPYFSSSFNNISTTIKPLQLSNNKQTETQMMRALMTIIAAVSFQKKKNPPQYSAFFIASNSEVSFSLHALYPHILTGSFLAQQNL